MTGLNRADVLVIGAGPAGIACAYFLQQAGIRYQVVDQASVLASTWADQYPSLRLNTSRFFSHMPGQRFPLHYGIFPSARQYHAYLEDFVAQQRLNIHLDIQIERVSPEGDGWRIESSVGTAWVPVVVLATGRFPKPYRAQLPGLDHFTGTVIHSQEFKDPAAFAGQRVMIVGNGPSGVDLAVALADVAATPVYLAQRTGILLRPRYPYGLPKHAWMLLTEWVPCGLTRRLERRALAAKIRHVADSGLKVPPPGQESGAAATRGPELMQVAQAGKVRSVAVPVAFDGSTARLADDQRLDLDTVILATGFKPALDYLDVDYETDEQGLPVREPRDFPVYPGYEPQPGYEVQGHPGLYVTGVYYQGKGAMFNFNVEAEIITRQIQERLATRPTPEPDFVLVVE